MKTRIRILNAIRLNNYDTGNYQNNTRNIRGMGSLTSLYVIKANFLISNT